MTSKFTTPKREEEFVQSISARTCLAAEELRKHDSESLKKIWSLVRPKKPKSPLPVGWKWKKLDVADLCDLYATEVRQAGLGSPGVATDCVRWDVLSSSRRSTSG